MDSRNIIKIKIAAFYLTYKNNKNYIPLPSRRAYAVPSAPSIAAFLFNFARVDILSPPDHGVDCPGLAKNALASKSNPARNRTKGLRGWNISPSSTIEDDVFRLQ